MHAKHSYIIDMIHTQTPAHIYLRESEDYTRQILRVCVSVCAQHMCGWGGADVNSLWI